MRIPPEWFHLYAGDQIHTRLAPAQLEAALASHQRNGWHFTRNPSERGHWLTCTRSPLVSPHQPDQQGTP